MKKNAWLAVAYRLRDYIRPECFLIATSLFALLLSTAVRLLKPLPLAFAVDYILVEAVEDIDVHDADVSDLKFDTSLFNISLESIDN